LSGGGAVRLDAGEVIQRVVSVESDHGSEERSRRSGGEVVGVFVEGDRD
jgi:hypothetical protein